MDSSYQPLVTVCIPTFNAARFIKPTLESLSAQTYKNFEVLIIDDGSKDTTCEMVARHGFPSLRIVKNEINQGCPKSIARGAELCTTDILIYLCHDDILSPYALERIMEAFKDPEIGAVTRPYLFFEEHLLDKPYRVAPPLNPHRDVVVRVDDDYPTIHGLIQTLGQLSAMGFRRSMMTMPFSPDVFTVHIQAFLGVLREHPVVLLSDYILAVRTETSQCRYVPQIYDPSPLGSWVAMLHRVFGEPHYRKILRYGLKVICTNNDVGLVQVKCMAGMRPLFKEIGISIRAWPLNLIRPYFLFWCFVTILMPRKVLRQTVDILKLIIGPRLVPTHAKLYGVEATSSS